MALGRTMHGLRARDIFADQGHLNLSPPRILINIHCDISCQEKMMMSTILYAAGFAVLAYGIACLTDWVMGITAPYSDIDVNERIAARKAGDRLRTQRRIPLQRGRSSLRHQIEIRELPFLC